MPDSIHPEMLSIIQQVKDGRLSVAEGANLLESLDESGLVSAGAAFNGAADGPDEEPGTQDDTPEVGWWANAWLVLLLTGTAVFLVGALMMGLTIDEKRSFWFICSWLPLSLGLLVMVAGAWSKYARWIHVRVRPEEGPKVSISMPLPIGLASWFLRTFDRLIPQIKQNHLDTLPILLDALRTTREPLWVEVDDPEGTQVRVFLL